MESVRALLWVGRISPLYLDNAPRGTRRVLRPREMARPLWGSRRPRDPRRPKMGRERGSWGVARAHCIDTSHRHSTGEVLHAGQARHQRGDVPLARAGLMAS